MISTIQAESFSQMSGVQTENTRDVGGGLNVGWIDVNDWMSYQNSPVNIPATGAYRIEYRVASLNGGGGWDDTEATIYNPWPPGTGAIEREPFAKFAEEYELGAGALAQIVVR